MTDVFSTQATKDKRQKPLRTRFSLWGWRDLPQEAEDCQNILGVCTGTDFAGAFAGSYQLADCVQHCQIGFLKDVV